MISFSDILAVIGLFVLRIGVPIAVVAGLAYALKRLDKRWQAEAEEQLTAQPPAVRPATQPAKQPVKQPAVSVPAAAAAAKAAAAERERVRVDKAGRPLPFDPTSLQPGLVARAEGRACWDVKGCAKSAYEQCAAYANPTQACWQARLEAEGKIPDACPSCEIFQRYPMI